MKKEELYRYAPIMILLMYTGLRVGEALDLTWDDNNFKERLIDVNKSIIYIPVDGKYESIVQNNGKTNSSMRVLPMYKNIPRNAGIIGKDEYRSVHTLRHTLCNYAV